MKKNKFSKVATKENNPRWKSAIRRAEALYSRSTDIRSEFFRDYNRILHCSAYSRLKYKTQVFFAARNDHLCNRIEHVNHVASVSTTIANFLGLNTELTNAISIGHDLGHAPFGHSGEDIINKIASDNGFDYFWHEKNSLRFVDKIETLLDPHNYHRNLNLTYAVRDGIVSHCGEVNETLIRPRDEDIDLELIKSASQYAPYTWEACVVKISDKIAYLGRDIEDAITCGILNQYPQGLIEIISSNLGDISKEKLNNTFIIHQMILDLCDNSTPEKGIMFSARYLKLLNEIKDFNYKHIYKHPRLENYKQYAECIIKSLYKTLVAYYDGLNTVKLLSKDHDFYPVLIKYFREWLIKYSNTPEHNHRKFKYYKNYIIYNLNHESDYKQAVIDFISGMTDRFAIRVFEEITSF